MSQVDARWCIPNKLTDATIGTIYPAARSGEAEGSVTSNDEINDLESDVPAAHDVECTELTNIERLQEAASSRAFGAVSGRSLNDLLCEKKQRKLYASVMWWDGDREKKYAKGLPDKHGWAFALCTDNNVLVEDDVTTTFRK